ncbi:Cdc6/Cdc18 family protein [Saliphagus sp. LR7]|uniref:Cdc6/Cdc18 family protein n=1 Tax=Saliphagus sp. LR7 TaxID=2282654 RepID=UPI000DF7CD70|nr:AAA family ATPase [Saliphagus sp. LR7]
MGDTNQDEFSVDQVIGNSPRIFRDKSLVSVGTVPDEDRIVGRQQEITNIALSLEDIIYNDVPDNAQIYGKTGTGKSLVSRHVSSKIVERAEANGVRAASIYIDCNQDNTITRAARSLYFSIFDELDKKFGISDQPDVTQPPKRGVGWRTYTEEIWGLVDGHYDGLIIILDEIDLLEEFNKLLHALSRARENDEIDTYISIILISNKTTQFRNDVNQRVQSSMGGSEFVFSAYDSDQLKNILENRRDAFEDGVLSDGTVSTAAELAADEHGDARKAIELLNKAGMMARRNMDEEVTEEHVEEARDLVEADLLSKSISTLPDQAKLVLYTLAKQLNGPASTVSTSQVYDRYQTVAKDVQSNVLGYQRVSDLLDELEFLGVTISERKGRGDRKGIKKDHELNHRPRIVLAATLAEDKRLQTLESVESSEDILQ